MKVKVDSCVYDVEHINIEEMIVLYSNRIRDVEHIEVCSCELLSENFIDNLAIKHVKHLQYKKLVDEINSINNNNQNKTEYSDRMLFDRNSKFTLDKQIIENNLDDVNKRLDKLSEGLSIEEDVVNKPKHYQIGLGEYEMKDVSYALIDHNKLDGREGAVYFNVLKYIGRFNNKGVPIQDLEKAEFYLKELIELTKEKDY